MKYLVLDEADKLFELGFVEQIDYVVKACSKITVVLHCSVWVFLLKNLQVQLWLMQFESSLVESMHVESYLHYELPSFLFRWYISNRTTFDRNSASEMIKQKPVFAGSEKGNFACYSSKLFRGTTDIFIFLAH